MVIKKLIWGVALLVGLAFSGAQQAQAADNVDNQIITVSSGYQPIPVYKDANTTQYSGKNLDTNINSWRVVRIAKSAYDLGNNQWVKSGDLRVVNAVTPDSNSPYYLIYSDNQALPIYASALFDKQIGTLDTGIDVWQITKTAFVDQSDALVGFDLGNNQWVKDGTLIEKYFWFYAGEPLYTSSGQPASTIQQTLQYRVFSAKKIANQLYVNLGADNQWVLYTSGSRFQKF
ncbi:MAG: hypothetical protein LKF36_00610 [Lactobacillus sp.]|nr:hypothetical protein [Lactobacillus sp.]